MPSWVLPAVAAELWGVSIEHVLAEVAAGRVRSRTEREFTFVDIDPNSGAGAVDEPSESRRLAYRRSLAWAMAAPSTPIVTAEERDALLADPSITHGEVGEDGPIGDAPPPAQLTADDIPDWAQVRARVSRTRRPPAVRDAA
jgi:hypothetical protein